MKNWGRELKVHRIYEGLTQQQLAERLNVAAETVSFWETSRRRMSIDVATKAFKALGYDLVIKRKRA